MNRLELKELLTCLVVFLFFFFPAIHSVLHSADNTAKGVERNGEGMGEG